MRFRHVSVLLVSIAVLSFFGCSSGQDASSPLTPDQDLQLNVQTNETGHYLWVYETISIDPETLDYDVIPDRASLGHYNILTWLENGPCMDCFSITGITPGSPGTLNVDIEITHPFSIANLTGFDVRGIAMFNGSLTFTESGLNLPDAGLGDGELLNADGYTTLYNPTTAGSGPNGLQGYQQGNFAPGIAPSALLNGYKRYMTDDPANTRNAFYAGDAVVATYEIDKPDGPFIFGYAVDACWAPPETTPVTDPMTDFGPDANCPEPWKVEVTETPIGDGLTDAGGSTTLAIDVYSHVEGPFTVYCEAPDLFTGELMTTTIVSTGVDHTRYELVVENLLLASFGDYRALVSVVNDNNPIVPEWIDLTAYQVVPLTVVSSVPMPPIAIAIADPNPQSEGLPIYFTDNGSYDPDGGSIVTYEWDWDNDGIFDEQGSVASHSWPLAGAYFVQFRVTDDEAVTDTLDVPLEIVILSVKVPPIAIATANPNPQDEGLPVIFADNGSYDPDGGAITLFEWDWENDGVFDDTGSNLDHIWPSAGTYFVQLRVTDDESATDTLDVPLEIVINSVSVPLTWDDQMAAILQDNCGPCHTSGTSGGLSVSSYQNLLDSDVMTPGNPDDSSLYTEIKDDTHFASLTPGDLDLLYQWILDGAPEF